ncbi:zinc ribbon domain-containing protein [Staphylococcus pseudoxylosus]|uniref:zinc ribbon domain-containing protein n=1 Tax=Staphylococcus pseudoxylosus TaxID=2282419 RepID=UPI003D155951
MGDVLLKYCNNCGNKLQERQRFCDKCGKSVSVDNKVTNNNSRPQPLKKIMVAK